MAMPEVAELWQDLTERERTNRLSNDEIILLRKWKTAIQHLAENPKHPGLQSHEIEPLSKRYGMRVWQSYLENKKSRSMRMYWVYGPDQATITIIALEPHPENNKRDGYTKLHLSDST